MEGLWKKFLIILILPIIIGCANVEKKSSSSTNLSSSASSLINSSNEIDFSENITSSNNNSLFLSTSSTINSENSNDSTQINKPKFRIMLISGHGLNDSGAIYQNRKEAEYNQNFVNMLTKEIDKYSHNLDIILEPTPMKAAQEAELISNHSLDFVLNIHFNAGGGKGSEMIVPFYENDFSFAYNFFDILLENDFLVRETSVYSKSKNQRIKRQKYDKSYSYDDYFAVIRAGAKKRVPSYILEVEFIDNVIQMQKYDQRKDIYISLLAKHIVDYFKNG